MNLPPEEINGKMYRVMIDLCSYLDCSGCAFDKSRNECTIPDSHSCCCEDREGGNDVYFVEIEE